MKKIVLIMVLFLTQMTFAQENRTISNLAYEFLKQNVKFDNDTPWPITSVGYDKMPNGGYLVTLVLSKTDKFYEEGWVNNQVQAYGAVFNVGVKRGLIAHENTQTRRYIVFTDSCGIPHNYVLSEYAPVFNYWGNNVWIMNKGHFEDKDLDFYCNFACYSYNGKLLWEKRGIAAFSLGCTGNTLYLVGNYINSKRSFVATVDTRNFEFKEDVGSRDVIPYCVDFKEDGVWIKQKNSYSAVTSYTIPYDANDKQFQIDLIAQKIKKLESDAAKGDLHSIRELAKRYYEGVGVEKNIQRALNLYSYLIATIDDKEKDILCIYRNDVFKDSMLVEQLGNDYIPNSSNPDERWNALRCEAAAIKGNTMAINEMIERYTEGKGVDKNETKCNELLMILAENGDSEAMLKLGQLLLDSTKPTTYNEKEGVEWYVKSAEKGNRTAKKMLSTFYFYGLHVKKDKKLAKILLKELE